MGCAIGRGIGTCRGGGCRATQAKQVAAQLQRRTGVRVLAVSGAVGRGSRALVSRAPRVRSGGHVGVETDFS